MSDPNKLAKKALIQLYLTVKIRKEDEADSITSEQLIEEEAKLIHLPLLTLISYVKSSIDTIVSLKLDEELNNMKDSLAADYSNAAQDYETLLRKEEAEIRGHISVQHQLKIHIEKITDELEDLDKENSLLRKKLKKANSTIEKKQREEKTSEIETLKKLIQSYEDKIMDFTLKENKLKTQLIEKEKEIKKLEIKLFTSRKTGSFIILNKDKYKESLSNNSSICSRSCSKNKVTDEDKLKTAKREISPLPFEKTHMMEKLEKYKKLIDKKVSEVTRNKSQLIRERSCASISYHSKERTMDNELSMIAAAAASKKDFSQRISETARQQGLKSELQKNTISVKKIPFPDNTFSKKAVYSNTSNKKNQTMAYNNKLHKSGSGNGNNQGGIPIVINHSEVPCVNNINIYAGNTNAIISESGQKSSNQVNLRQYIFTKCNPNNLLNKVRSNSKG